jgi:hypothetical protein
VSDGPTYLAELEPVLDGARKAGVPNNDRRLAAVLRVDVGSYSLLRGENGRGTAKGVREPA